MTRWPTFLVLSPRCGGGAQLLTALQSLPGVFAPTAQIGFFSLHWDKGPAWYAQHFRDAGDALAIGELSTSYVQTGLAADVAPRIDGFLADVRLVAVVRDPLARALAVYQELRAASAISEAISFEQALHDGEDRYALRSGGRYTGWLGPYVERFGDRLLLVPYPTTSTGGMAVAALEHLGLPATLSERLGRAWAAPMIRPPLQADVFEDELAELSERFGLASLVEEPS